MKIKIGHRYQLVTETDGKKDNKKFVLLTTSLPPEWVYESVEVPKNKERVVVRVLAKQGYKAASGRQETAYRVLFLEEEWFVFGWQFLKEVK